MHGNDSCPLLILDCDGVLIRSEDANLAYYNHIFARFGVPCVEKTDRERFTLLHTLSTPQVIDAFFPIERRAEVASFVADLRFDPFVSLVRPEPGWDQVLADWRHVGGKSAVATNRGNSAEEVLQAAGLRPWVDEVITIKHVPRPKPHPDMLLRVLELFGVRPSRGVYVGDSELDQRAAEAAGIPFIGFRYPASPSVRSAAEVPGYLREFAAGSFPARFQTGVP